MEINNNIFRVIVAGGRYFNNYKLLTERLDYYISNKSNVVIISGTAKGADSLGEKYALEKGLETERYPADWNSHGKSAGYIRNKQMSEVADAVICFWDGKSRGTKHMIDIAISKEIPLKIVRY